MRILICGLPSAGKTTVAKALAARLKCPHHDGDTVRSLFGVMPTPHVNERIQQAVRMKQITAPIHDAGGTVVCSFICPTHECRAAFGADVTIWVARTGPAASRYTDTKTMWQDPIKADVILDSGETVDQWVGRIISFLSRPKWDVTGPTGLVIGRFQPFHEGHMELVKRVLGIYPQVLIGVRQLHRDGKNPFDYTTVYNRISECMRSAGYDGRYQIITMPNIAEVAYGRDVGYRLHQYRLAPEFENISGTATREQLVKDGVLSPPHGTGS